MISVLRIIANFLSRILFIIPRSRVIVFIGPSYNLYKDNSRAAFELSSERLKAIDYDSYWITDSYEIIELLRLRKLAGLRKNSIRTLYIFLSAKFVVSGETAVPTLNGFSNFGATHICVSHGFGPRTTAIADGAMFKTNNDVRRALNSFDFYLFPNKFLASQLGLACYDMNPRKFLITQQPRLSSSYKEDFQFIQEGKFCILYCPTWRQNGDSPLDLILRSVDSLSLLDQTLNTNGAILFIAGHPLVGSVACVDNFQNIIFVGSPYLDVSLLISKVDLVVSDYSSLITDAVFLKKPILLYCPDYDYYQYEYGLNVLLRDEFESNVFVEKFDEVLVRMCDVSIDSSARYFGKFCSAESDFLPTFLDLIGDRN